MSTIKWQNLRIIRHGIRSLAQIVQAVLSRIFWPDTCSDFGPGGWDVGEFCENSTPLKTRAGASCHQVMEVKQGGGVVFLFFRVFFLVLRCGFSPALWGCCPPGLPPPHRHPLQTPSGCSAGFLAVHRTMGTVWVEHQRRAVLFCQDIHYTWGLSSGKVDIAHITL